MTGNEKEARSEERSSTAANEALDCNSVGFAFLFFPQICIQLEKKGFC